MVRKEIYSNGDIRYFNELNNFHREDGPAVEFISGSKVWYINGLCHRADGPAVVWHTGYRSYWLMDKEFSYEDWLAIKDFPLLW